MVRKQRGTGYVKRIVALLALLLLVPSTAFAAQSNSTHYQVNEVFMGTGGELNSCSTSYCSKQSAGELTVGATGSTNYTARAGFNTDRQPFIEFNVSNTNVALGNLSTTTTRTATSTFSVKTYLAHGYSVINASDPPVNNSHTLSPLTIPTASNNGDEQFGINLVANTNPVSFGADPTHTPDNTFSYGIVNADYSIPNMYKYLKGDTVAYSPLSSSTTNYTVSYIFNISPVTPGGSYAVRHILVATSTY